VAEGRRYFISIAALIAGLFIVYSTAPRVMAYVVMRGGDSTIFDLGRGKDVSERDISLAISGRQASLRWFERGRTYLEIAVLYLFLADNPKFDVKLRKSFLTKSMAAFRNGLVLEPRNPYAWLQFAQAQFRQDRRSETIKHYLEMSYIVAPQEPRIVVTRVHLAFRAQKILARNLRAKLREDIRLYLKHQARQLTFFARNRFALPWLAEIAKDDPALLREFYRQFLKLPPPGQS
jgi:hypothetical protein